MKFVFLGFCAFVLCAATTAAHAGQIHMAQAPEEAAAPAGGGSPSAAEPPPPTGEEKEILDRLAKIKSKQPKDETEEREMRKAYLGSLKEHRTKFPNSPRAPMIMQSTVQLMASSGQMQDALNLVNDFLKDHTGLDESLFGTALLMDLYSGSQQLQRAAETVQDFLKAHPGAPSEDAMTYKLVGYLSDMGKMDEAVAVLDKYVKAHPDHPRAHMFVLRKADILAHGGKSEQAITELEALLPQKLTDEDKTLANYLLALAYMARSRQVSGKEIGELRTKSLASCETLMAAARKNPATGAPYGAMSFSAAADVHLANGDKEKATKCYEELAKIYKDKPEGAFAQQAIKDTALVGTAAPDIEGTALDGSKVSLKSLAKKVVLVDFWATWCPPCLEDLPNVHRLVKEMEGRPFAVIAVSLDRPGKAADLKKFVAKSKMTWPQLYDEKGWGSPIVKAYGITALPGSVVIDGTGKVVRMGLHGAHLKDVVNDELLKVEGKVGGK
jgi:peroxiredoxin/predicted Zn-dependent protease